MQLNFDDRRVLVTGAAQGIGRAIVKAFAADGAKVWAVDRDGAGLARVGLEGASAIRALDLAERTAVRDLVDDMVEALGGIDVLVTAAGGVCGQVGGPLEDVEPDGWHAIFRANVESTLWCAQAAAPFMKLRKFGRIVTISSGAGLRPSLTGIQAYTSAKHALVGLTRQLALDLGPYGITANSVAPGFVPSNPSSIAQWESYSPERQAQIIAGTHTRRLGTPEDIAAAVQFLASDQAGWITGQILSVDGGRA